MVKKERMKTSTVSVCVTGDEAQLVRDAAAGASLTVSAWSANRVVLAMATPASRARVTQVAETMADIAPKPERPGRVSMVMRLPDHEYLKGYAAEKRMTTHAFAQAALLDAAATEVNAMPPGQARAIEKVQRAGTGGTVLVSVPASMASLDVEAISALVCSLLQGIVGAIRKDKGAVIAAGAPAMAQRAADAGRMVTVKLFVPEFELRAVAFVLGIDHNALVTALAMKAAKAR